MTGVYAAIAQAIAAILMPWVGWLHTVNDTRALAGVDPLALDPALIISAEDWSDRMATAQVLEHAPDLAPGAPPGWGRLGENVGQAEQGQDQATALHEAFVASPTHYANLVQPDYTRLGVGLTTDTHGRLWVTLRFWAPVTDSR